MKVSARLWWSCQLLLLITDKDSLISGAFANNPLRSGIILEQLGLSGEEGQHQLVTGRYRKKEEELRGKDTTIQDMTGILQFVDNRGGGAATTRVLFTLSSVWQVINRSISFLHTTCLLTA